MTAPNAAVEATTKAAVREQVKGGQTTVTAPLTQTEIGQFNGTVQGETWPEYVAGMGYPNWVEDGILHPNVATSGSPNPAYTYQGTRVQAKQIVTNPEGIGSEVFPPNWPPYGTQNQVGQVETKVSYQS